MNTEQLIKQEAEKGFPSSTDVYDFVNKERREVWILGATFGASLNGWVSVKDSGLPEREKSVIIKCTGHRVATSGYIHERGHWIISNQNGSTYTENDMHRVTHWMPFPEPPIVKP